MKSGILECTFIIKTFNDQSMKGAELRASTRCHMMQKLLGGYFWPVVFRYFYTGKGIRYTGLKQLFTAITGTHTKGCTSVSIWAKNKLY